MEKCIQLGLVHNIGVSNFNIEQITRLLNSAKVRPTVNQLQRGLVVIPKSSNNERIEENADIFNFELTSKEMCQIDKYNLNERAFKFIEAKSHRDYPFEK
uniref:NADP-dependent oxidoreductase domain-containing protein n=1 Tax=Clastoptera arizonana TaxID=38151 RepID=A0A1B6CRA1_9HEMI